MKKNNCYTKIIFNEDNTINVKVLDHIFIEDKCTECSLQVEGFDEYVTRNSLFSNIPNLSKDEKVTN